MSGFVPADGRSYDAPRTVPPSEADAPIPIVPPAESEVVPPADGRSFDAERITPADVGRLEDVIPVVPPAPSEESEAVPPVDTPRE